MKVRRELAAFLDMARWLAALLVVLFHVRGLFFVAWSQLPKHGAWEAVCWMTMSLGHQAVIIFFVLSGYLVGGSVLGDNRDGTFHLRSYAIHRFSRLYAVLPAALLIGGALDVCGSHIFNYAPITAGWDDAAPFSAHLTWHVALINLVNCQGILGPELGSNGPLWSLSYEFWYYALFPAAVLSLDRRRHTPQRLLSTVVAVSIAVFVGKKILAYFAVWLVGALLWRLRRAIVRSLSWAVALFVIMLVSAMPITHWAIGHGVEPFLVEFTTDGFLAVAFGNLVLRVAHHGVGAGLPEWILRWNKRLATFTYTLYLTHAPLLALASGAIRAATGAKDRFLFPNATGMLTTAGLVALTYVYAYAIAWATERRTPALRAWLAARLGRPSIR